MSYFMIKYFLAAIAFYFFSTALISILNSVCFSSERCFSILCSFCFLKLLNFDSKDVKTVKIQFRQKNIRKIKSLAIYLRKFRVFNHIVLHFLFFYSESMLFMCAFFQLPKSSIKELILYLKNFHYLFL